MWLASRIIPCSFIDRVMNLLWLVTGGPFSPGNAGSWLQDQCATADATPKGAGWFCFATNAPSIFINVIFVAVAVAVISILLAVAWAVLNALIRFGATIYGMLPVSKGLP